MASEAKTADRTRIRVWDVGLRLFHWLLVLAIALAFLSSEEESPLNRWHVVSGWGAALLLVFRLVWGFVGGEHARFASFVRPGRLAGHLRELARGRPPPSLGHNALGALSVLLLLAFAAATVWTGAFIDRTANEEIHEVIAWALLALVAVHVIAVVVMSAMTRENLVRAMIDGTKPAARHPGARDAGPAGAVGWIFAAVVVAASLWVVTRYDPQAFEARSAESFEHRGMSGDSGRESRQEAGDEGD